MSYLDNTGVATLAAKLAVKVQAAIQAATVDFTGATSSAAGAHGFVPAPSAGDQGKLLRGDGTWTNGYVASFNGSTGAITYTETDPTVPSWAKASSKPSYTASEVGAVPTSRTVNGKALSANISLSASDVDALPSSTTIPTKTSDLTNDSGFITSAPVTSVNGATGDVTIPTMTGATSSAGGAAGLVPVPSTGDVSKVLNGAGSWVSKDPLFINDAASSKIYLLGTTTTPRSEAQFTGTLKAAGDGTATRIYMDASADTLVAPKFSGNGSAITNLSAGNLASGTVPVARLPLATTSNVGGVKVGSGLAVDGNGVLSSNVTVPTKTSDLTNDSGFITGYTETDPTVPSWAKAASKPSYTASEVGAVPTTRKVNNKALSADITLTASDVGAQATLVSGTNIKTINNESILGSGNLSVSPTAMTSSEIITAVQTGWGVSVPLSAIGVSF